MSIERNESDSIALSEAQVILAEKRTSLALMRTGIAVLALPMSVMGLLIATSKYYDVFHVMHLLIPLGVLILALICLGTALVIRSIISLRNDDKILRQIKSKHSMIGKYVG